MLPSGRLTAGNHPLTSAQQIVFIIALVCTCDITGTVDENQCAHAADGQCDCKSGISGALCESCNDGLWGFGKSNLIDFPCKRKFFVSKP